MHVRGITFLSEDYPTDSYYPFNLETFRRTRSLKLETPVTLFAGENGSGKSTLLRAIANRCGIHIWKTIETSRFEINPYEQLLWRFIDVEWTGDYVSGSFFSSEMFYDFARNLDEWAVSDPGTLRYFGGKSLMTQSHGQSLMSFFEARYRIKGLYLMDEPETALSPRTQLDLLNLLEETGKAGHAQFIVATHSPILLACSGATIYSFDQIPIDEIAYEDTEHYRVYRDFMKKMERKLAR
ncbi:MAG: AAA family ATPase [Thermodesulfobacteriota bacterium]